MKKIKHSFFLIAMDVKRYWKIFIKLLNSYKNYIYSSLIIFPFIITINTTLIGLAQDAKLGMTSKVFELFITASYVSIVLSFLYSLLVHDIKRTFLYLVASFLFVLTIYVPYEYVWMTYLTIFIDLYLSFIWVKLLKYIDRTYFSKSKTFPATIVGFIGAILAALIGLIR